MTPGAIRQKAHRERQRERSVAMRAALEAILVRLTDYNKPVMTDVKRIAREGLGITRSSEENDT